MPFLEIFITALLVFIICYASYDLGRLSSKAKSVMDSIPTDVPLHPRFIAGFKAGHQRAKARYRNKDQG